jgi:hypothetical protein
MHDVAEGFAQRSIRPGNAMGQWEHTFRLWTCELPYKRYRSFFDRVAETCKDTEQKSGQSSKCIGRGLGAVTSRRRTKEVSTLAR